MRYDITIGLDIGKSKTRGVLLDNYKIKKIVEIRYDAKAPKKSELKKSILGVIEKLMEFSKKKIMAIGIGFPAPIIDGKLEKVFRISDLGKIKIEKFIQKKYKIPVFVENDANLAALGEYYFGFTQKLIRANQRLNHPRKSAFIKSLFLIILGTGVGGGFIKDEKIQHGRWSSGYELGHTTIVAKNGNACACGKRGHVESYVSSQFFKNRKLNSFKVFDDAKKNKKYALKLWEEYGFYLGITIANVINLIEPEVIVLAAGLSNAYGFFIKSAEKTAKENIVLKAVAKKVKIYKSRLGQNAGVLGAAMLPRII